MKTLWTLYVKEWKDSRYVFGVVGICLLVLMVYGAYAYDRDIEGWMKPARNFLPFALVIAGSFFAPAFLLARSFSSEWKSDTHYQWFSLPVKKWISVFGKVATAFSQGVIFLVVSFTFLLCFELYRVDHSKSVDRILERFSDLTVGQIMWYATDVAIVTVLPIVIYLMLTLALVVAMEGVKFVLHRHRGIAALVFFAGSIYLYGRFFRVAYDHLRILGRFNPVSFWEEGSLVGGMELAIYVYPLLALVALMGLGLLLFEKRVEI